MGITYNFGEREPWVELYNAGVSAVSLEGYILANNYNSNLTPGAFPSGSSIAPGEYKIVWADREANVGRVAWNVQGMQSACRPSRG